MEDTAYTNKKAIISYSLTIVRIVEFKMLLNNKVSKTTNYPHQSVQDNPELI